ncbi:MAG: AAA family ATPase [Pirellulales bacterium]
MADQPPLIRALQDPAAYPHVVAAVELVETHLSWVLLTGQFAYKIKKPVRLDFVDFSTLERRREACRDELRLNRRFAPQIYLDVVAISGSPLQPVFGKADETGVPVEYAVKMVQFPSAARLDRVLAGGQFQPADCDRLAALVAVSHRCAAVAASDTPFGNPTTIAKHVRDVLNTAVDQTRGGPDAELVSALRLWMEGECERLTPAFETRKADGWVRECHGDLHSENIAILEGEPVPFDCLEFREDLRWIDCASDVAFVTMDLSDRGYSQFANRLLNAYIELTGDLAALDVLRFYQAYRAVVRAVVATLQCPANELAPGRITERARTYLGLAEQYSRPGRPTLIITHGLSGTGKSTVTQELLEQLGTIRLRSDVERGRRDGVGTGTEKPQHPVDRYTQAARQAVYDELLRKAEIGLAAGYSIIVDATFLRRGHRDAFRRLTERRNVTFVILVFDADPATLRQRIEERQQGGRDASEATIAVLEKQLAERESLRGDECDFVITVHGGDVGPAKRRLSEIVRL